MVQVIITRGSPGAFRTAQDLALESVVEVVGRVKEEKQAPGGFEGWRRGFFLCLTNGPIADSGRSLPEF